MIHHGVTAVAPWKKKKKVCSHPPVKWILSHILETNLQQSMTHQRQSGKQTPLLMLAIVEAGTVGCWGDIMALTINQLSARPFSLQGVSVETERFSLLMLHELT